MIGKLITRLKKYKQVVYGAILVLVVLIPAIFAPFFTNYGPSKYNVRDRLQPPSMNHLAGTDHFGRDVFSRILYGARISMIVGLSVLLLCGIIGIILGLIAGYFTRAEALLMRILDGLMAFPAILLALVILAVLGPGLKNVIMALSISYIPRVARIVRSSVIVVKKYDHVAAARALGATDLQIILKHILPLCWSPIIIRLTLIMVFTIMTEASLTFLGVGISPEIPSWGNIMSEGRFYMSVAPWLTLIPGLAILIAALGFNIIGDGLRDFLDPKLKDI